jgi:hypothetical protein
VRPKRFAAKELASAAAEGAPSEAKEPEGAPSEAARPKRFEAKEPGVPSSEPSPEGAPSGAKEPEGAPSGAKEPEAIVERIWEARERRSVAVRDYVAALLAKALRDKTVRVDDSGVLCVALEGPLAYSVDVIEADAASMPGVGVSTIPAFPFAETGFRMLRIEPTAPLMALGGAAEAYARLKQSVLPPVLELFASMAATGEGTRDLEDGSIEFVVAAERGAKEQPGLYCPVHTTVVAQALRELPGVQRASATLTNYLRCVMSKPLTEEAGSDTLQTISYSAW